MSVVLILIAFSAFLLALSGVTSPTTKYRISLSPSLPIKTIVLEEGGIEGVEIGEQFYIRGKEMPFIRIK